MADPTYPTSYVKHWSAWNTCLVTAYFESPTLASTWGHRIGEVGGFAGMEWVGPVQSLQSYTGTTGYGVISVPLEYGTIWAEVYAYSTNGTFNMATAPSTQVYYVQEMYQNTPTGGAVVGENLTQWDLVMPGAATGYWVEYEHPTTKVWTLSVTSDTPSDTWETVIEQTTLEAVACPSTIENLSGTASVRWRSRKVYRTSPTEVTYGPYTAPSTVTMPVAISQTIYPTSYAQVWSAWNVCVVEAYFQKTPTLPSTYHFLIDEEPAIPGDELTGGPTSFYDYTGTTGTAKILITEPRGLLGAHTYAYCPNGAVFNQSNAPKTYVAYNQVMYLNTPVGGNVVGVNETRWDLVITGGATGYQIEYEDPATGIWYSSVDSDSPTDSWADPILPPTIISDVHAFSMLESESEVPIAVKWRARLVFRANAGSVSYGPYTATVTVTMEVAQPGELPPAPGEPPPPAVKHYPKQRIWPRFSILVSDIIADVRRLSGDRLGLIVSDDEVLDDINAVIYEAWPTYGELWRYRLPCDDAEGGSWNLGAAVEQAVPFAVRAYDSAGHSLLLSSWTLVAGVLTVPAIYCSTAAYITCEVLLPPLRPELDTTGVPKTTVNRRYVGLVTTRRVLDMLAERAGQDVLDRQLALDMQISLEMLRSGGGPSRDSLGVANG